MNDIFLKLRFLWDAHVKGAFSGSHAERGRARRAARGRYLRDYLRRFDRQFLDVQPDEPGSAVPEPERIFTIWLQGEEAMPPLVRACVESMRRETGLEVVVLDADTIADWITLPEDITAMWHSGRIGPAHFTDICRVALLYTHGGIWMDATDIATGPVPDYVRRGEVFLYETRTDPRYFHIGFQNCYMYARKGCFLMKSWLNAMMVYWRSVGRAKAYMIHQLMLDYLVGLDPRVGEIYARMPHMEQNPTHLLWWHYGLEPYDERVMEELRAMAPFQKADRRSDPRVTEGCFRDVIVKKYL